MTEHEVEYQRVLGQQLLALRSRRGLTRAELTAKLPSRPAVDTLASWEQGTRRMSVARLLELCLELGETPATVLAHVHDQVFPAPPPDELRLDVAALLAAAPRGLLAPLMRWAAARFDRGSAPAETCLTPEAAAALARLCEIPVPALRRLLAPFSPAAGRG